MGFAFMTGNCWVCRKLFSFNPVRVPSIRDGSGVRQPICRECIEMANRAVSYTHLTLPTILRV